MVTLRYGEGQEYHKLCINALKLMREQESAKNAHCSSWISLNDRLPEMKADVLMYFNIEKNMAVGFLCDIDEDKTMWCAYTDDGYYTDCDFEPTHWMPLPEPPELKEGDDT